MGKKGCSKIQNTKLNTYDWLCDVPDAENATDYVEVQFKNTRKGYFLNSSKIPLEKGDMVAVEASPGHDIGTVTPWYSTSPIFMFSPRSAAIWRERIMVACSFAFASSYFSISVGFALRYTFLGSYPSPVRINTRGMATRLFSTTSQTNVSTSAS